MPTATAYMTLIDFKEKQREAKTLYRSFDEWLKADNVEKLPHGAVMLLMDCDRCGLGRDRYIGPFCEIDGSLNRYHYDRAPGYLYQDEKGSGYALDKADRMRIRAELRRRSQERAASAARAARKR
jgi:uncharacterized Zn finger protein (UPF0148 family)